MTKTARLIICLVGVVVAGNNTWSQTEPPSGKVVAQVVAQEPSPMAGETTLEGDTFSYEESFFTQGAAYTYPTTSISETQIPADAPERTVRFDNNVVTLTFPGVNPLSNYNLELSFLSDTNDRVEQVSAGGAILEGALTLPQAQVLKCHWQIPASAYKDGTLVIDVKKIAGPNAVVAGAILSDDDAGAPVLSRPRIVMKLPRLSPQPQAVAGVKQLRIDLGGTWRFCAKSPDDVARTMSGPTDTGWSNIQVPGQWLQQGFTLEDNMTAVYSRSFSVPNDWLGKRIKLRCDAVYSDATVWINGKNMGRHLGGFTPFELDITDAVIPGHDATIALSVKSTGDADTLASGIKYAAHDLGGISRKIQVQALPLVNLAAVHIQTIFDGKFQNATLEVTARIANDGGVDSPETELHLALNDPDGKAVPIQPGNLRIPGLKPGQSFVSVTKLPIVAPLKWDVEHPRLYRLDTTIGNKENSEVVTTRVGFRQVDVRGSQVLINGQPVKLHGVCRHEIDPLRGRSLSGDTWREDAEMFTHANVNFVRTSHYPPAEEFLDACDELGIFVESEAPVCWASPDNKTLPLLLSETMEMVEFNRNHPSVIIWSIANESDWNPCFDLSSRMVQKLDPSRPRIFSYGAIDLASWHYPGTKDIAGRNDPIPVLADEYSHLNAYNRREQISDPGLRDMWGLGFAKTWEAIYSQPALLGGSIWAGIDDTFFLPGDKTVGYGTWGIMDEWRRPKPEYWHVTKVYSPVRILDERVGAPSAGAPIRLTVENRSDFSDLQEMHFDWKLGAQSGRVTTTGAPGQKGTLEIPVLGTDLEGKDLEIRVTGPRGFQVDAYRFTLGGESRAVPAPLRESGGIKLTQDSQTIEISGKDFSYFLDAETGQLKQGISSGHQFSLSGPFLTLVAHDPEGGGVQLTGKEPNLQPQWGLCTAWKASSVSATQSGENVTVKISGTYGEAEGEYVMSIDGAGRLTVSWNFNTKQAINPHQMGVTFVLPKTFDTLSWRRRGQWSFYPDDHIGRLVGTAKAFSGHPTCGLVGPRSRPTWPWNEDQSIFGSNDFRSTKTNIFEARLTDESGLGLRAVAAADRDAHAWIDGDQAMFMVASYADDGSEPFFQVTRSISDHPLGAGGPITGSAQFELASPRG